jgi:hypothetical protein
MGVGSATSIYPSCGCPVLWVVVDFRRPATLPVAAAPLAPKAPDQTVAVKAATVKAAPNVTVVTADTTGTVAAAAAPTIAPSATALRSQLAPSASPASTGDPVSRMLNFATVLSQLPN